MCRRAEKNILSRIAARRRLGKNSDTHLTLAPRGFPRRQTSCRILARVRASSSPLLTRAGKIVSASQKKHTLLFHTHIETTCRKIVTRKTRRDIKFVSRFFARHGERAPDRIGYRHAAHRPRMATPAPPFARGGPDAAAHSQHLVGLPTKVTTRVNAPGNRGKR